MNFSEKIKQIRQQRFLSQEAFAKELMSRYYDKAKNLIEEN